MVSPLDRQVQYQKSLEIMKVFVSFPFYYVILIKDNWLGDGFFQQVQMSITMLPLLGHTFIITVRHDKVWIPKLLVVHNKDSMERAPVLLPLQSCLLFTSYAQQPCLGQISGLQCCDRYEISISVFCCIEVHPSSKRDKVTH